MRSVVQKYGVRLWLARYPLAAAIGMGVMAIGVVLYRHVREEIIHGKAIVTRLEALSYDTPFLLRWSSGMQRECLLIDITTNSFSPATASRRALRIDRAVMATLLEHIETLSPKVVVLDILFDEERGEGDLQLAQTLARLAKSTPTVLATTTLLPGSLEAELEGEQTPHEPVTALFRDTGVLLGVADVDNRPGNTVRLVPGLFGTEARPSLAYVAARAISPSFANSRNRETLRWMNYYGPMREVFARYELREFLDATAKQAGDTRLAVHEHRGRIVLVGFAPPLEQFRSPIHSETIGGSDLHATAILNLLNGDWLSPAPVPLQLVFFCIYGLWLGLLLGRHRTSAGVCGGLCSAVILSGAAVVSHLHFGLWWWWVIVLLQATAAVGASIVPPGYAAFISYRNSDGADPALALEQGLLARGVRAYVAPGNIDIGACFTDEILRRLRQAPFFVLILSDDARRELRTGSGWVAKEVEAALRFRKTIVVVRPCIRSSTTDSQLSSAPEPVPPLRTEDLDKRFSLLADLQEVVLDTGEHRKTTLDAIRRCLW